MFSLLFSPAERKGSSKDRFPSPEHIYANRRRRPVSGKFKVLQKFWAAEQEGGGGEKKMFSAPAKRVGEPLEPRRRRRWIGDNGNSVGRVASSIRQRNRKQRRGI